MGLGGWWWSEVKVECAPAVQQECTPAASAWLSVFMVRPRTILNSVSGSVGLLVCWRQHKFQHKFQHKHFV